MKKYSSGSFIDAAVRVYGSEADTITSFPATVYADGESASAIVYGNMQQTVTPTPTTPITPSECGDLETTGEHTGQYKIPISSANTTTPVYLGEVQSTRRIKKLVLTGEENWAYSSGGFYLATISDDYLRGEGQNYALCSHYITVGQTNSITNMPADSVSFSYGTGSQRLYLVDSTYSSASTTIFKAYLAQQYADGTPICVWYVLATPTTGIVNEPLRKISNYADTITTTIPTLAAADNINVTTTLKPSAVQLTYTGWHTHSDKKRSGGAWT